MLCLCGFELYSHWVPLIKDLDATIMFSTDVMNEQTENNKQANCFLKIFIRKSISLLLKAIHVHTDWIVRIRFHK